MSFKFLRHQQAADQDRRNSRERSIDLVRSMLMQFNITNFQLQRAIRLMSINLSQLTRQRPGHLLVVCTSLVQVVHQLSPPRSRTSAGSIDITRGYRWHTAQASFSQSERLLRSTVKVHQPRQTSTQDGSLHPLDVLFVLQVITDATPTTRRTMVEFYYLCS